MMGNPLMLRSHEPQSLCVNPLEFGFGRWPHLRVVRIRRKPGVKHKSTAGGGWQVAVKKLSDCEGVQFQDNRRNGGSDLAEDVRNDCRRE
jgi:hypothetical protein